MHTTCSTSTSTTSPATRGTCTHQPHCPPADAPDAAAAKIVAEHLQECGYALLCNGRVLMEHGGLLPVPAPRQQVAHAG